jgi:hypothetical protein
MSAMKVIQCDVVTRGKTDLLNLSKAIRAGALAGANI